MWGCMCLQSLFFQRVVIALRSRLPCTGVLNGESMRVPIPAWGVISLLEHALSENVSLQMEGLSHNPREIASNSPNHW